MEDNVDDSLDDLLCDYCQQSADRNPLGEPEELLICKDCGNKGNFASARNVIKRPLVIFCMLYTCWVSLITIDESKIPQKLVISISTVCVFRFVTEMTI